MKRQKTDMKENKKEKQAKREKKKQI